MAHPLVELLFASAADDDETGSSARWGHEGPPPESKLDLTDATLIQCIRDGDVEAFRSLYLNTFRELWSFARRYVDSAAVAEEVVQDVFFRIWERRATWEVRGAVRGYLFGAVRNHALHIVEHHAVERRTNDAVVQERAGHSEQRDGDLLSSMSREELASAVAKAIAALPERQRAAMLLRLNHGLTHAQIGDALGVAASVAGRLVVKGEEKLRQRLAGVMKDL